VKLIVNADDFGFSSKVNERIVDLLSRRRITSATLMANAPAVEDAVRRLPTMVQCSLGAHLNLTEFEPLTPPKQRGILTEYLDCQGGFLKEEVLRSVRMTSLFREACFNELSLQVVKLLSLGLRISHFDSHNHIHTIPALFPVIKRLQKRFGIRKVRTTWNIYRSNAKPRMSVLLKKRIWHWGLRHYYPTTTTAGFTSFDTFYERAIRGSLDHDLIEVEVHPGNDAYEHETQLLETDWQDRIPYSVSPISYDQI